MERKLRQLLYPFVETGVKGEIVAGTPLIIDNEKLEDLRAFAQANPISLSELMKITEENAPVVGEREGYSINLDFGYRLVYSVEEHPDGWMRHMSMSQVRPGRSPNRAAIDLMLEALGFPLFDKCLVYMEGEIICAMVQVGT